MHDDVDNPNAPRVEDLTRRVTELEDALRAAENRADYWMSIVSHDLRGPLTLIQGYAENLLHRYRSGREAGKSIHDLEAIVVAARRLNKMVTQVVEGSRLDRCRLTLNPRKIDLTPILRGASRTAFKLNPTHPLRVDVPGQLPPVRCDPRAVESIVGALLSNAAIFSPPESPVVLTAREFGSRIMVSIVDRGPGLLPDEKERIFEPRFRPDRLRDARREGIGLSLWTARGLALLSGGDLTVESDGPDLGTTAVLSLPVADVDDGSPGDG